jgi:hypothetical protein
MGFQTILKSLVDPYLLLWLSKSPTERSLNKSTPSYKNIGMDYYECSKEELEKSSCKVLTSSSGDTSPSNIIIDINYCEYSKQELDKSSRPDLTLRVYGNQLKNERSLNKSTPSYKNIGINYCEYSKQELDKSSRPDLTVRVFGNQLKNEEHGSSDSRSIYEGEFGKKKMSKPAAVSGRPTSSPKSELPVTPGQKSHSSLFRNVIHPAKEPTCPTAVIKDVERTCRPAVHNALSDKACRCKNVVVIGLPHVIGTGDGELFQNFCATHLSIKPTIVVERCRRLGRPISGKIQPLLVTLTSPQAASELLQAARARRKSTDAAIHTVFINPDMTSAQRKRAYKNRVWRRQQKMSTLHASDRRDCGHSLDASGSCDYDPEGIAGNRVGTHRDKKVNAGNGFLKLQSAGVLTKEKVEECEMFTSFEAVFKGKHRILEKQLDLTSGLLTLLRDEGVLTKEHIDEISHPTKRDSESVKALLAALERRPVSDFEKFLKCLFETNQKHIIDELL